jgi:hypothetical protein
MKEYKTESNTSRLSSWITFYPRFNLGFYVEKAGYLDERPLVHTSASQLLFLMLFVLTIDITWYALLLIPYIILFGWGKMYIHLPIRTGIEDCDSAAWGIDYHDNMLWIYIGGAGNFEGGRKCKTITMPWSMTWVRTSTLMKGDNDWWFNEIEGARKSYVEDAEGVIIGSYDWLNKNKWQETHPYLDKYDNTTVNATIGVSEREWRPLWFKWTSLFAKTRRVVDIDFDKEVGKKKGSWKGGNICCSYNLLPNETAFECLKRMEKEREF